MKIIITLSDIIGISVFSLFVFGTILYILFAIISDKYKEKSHKWHNCNECKYHYFKSTPSWYSCEKHLYDGQHEPSDTIWTKCKYWEK